jgi:acyl carrier protein
VKILKEQKMSAAVSAKVRDFIIENFLFRDDREQLDDSESLLDAGLIDSTGILELVAFIETEFVIQMTDSEIVPENLDSVDQIVRYLFGKIQAEPGRPAPHRLAEAVPR